MLHIYRGRGWFVKIDVESYDGFKKVKELNSKRQSRLKQMRIIIEIAKGKWKMYYNGRVGNIDG